MKAMTARRWLPWLLLTLAEAALAQPTRSDCPSLLRHSLPRLQDEKPVDLCSFAGKVLLVVNTASQCGYTPQYRALEALQRRYAGRGFVVLGFPSNDFGGQEPGSNEAIADFCENQFAVRFPMFAKSSVRAGTATAVNPLYAALAVRAGAPQWNFHKYLVSRDGRVVLGRTSAVEPDDAGFIRDLERLLDQRSN